MFLSKPSWRGRTDVVTQAKAWTPTEATNGIRRFAGEKTLALTYKLHARERMAERGLIVGDVLYVLKNGFVHEEAAPATRVGYYKYCIESRTPNSGGRQVRLVVIPDERGPLIKIVTIMWVDEDATRAGSILGD